MEPQRHYKISEDGEVGMVRRAALELGRQVGLNETDLGRLAVVATELATNVVKHARTGELLLRPLIDDTGSAVEVLALDRGPGIADLTQAMRDGYSSAGSAGTGLGALLRMSTSFDIYSQGGAGTAAVARVAAGALPASAYRLGVVSVPHVGESLNGDGWAVEGDQHRVVVMVVDGLGHGDNAALASREAERLFRAGSTLAIDDLLQRIHAGLRHTRGAALAIAEILRDAGEVRYTGVGNISGVLVAGAHSRSMVSINGIVGGDFRRIQVFTYPFTGQTLLVAHSDGLTAHWNLDTYPGLLARDPSLIAGVLYRDATRGRDDATVLALRMEATP